MHRIILSLLLTAAMGMCASRAGAVNSVVVESRSFPIDTLVACTVGVYLSNDVAITGVVLPLELRTVYGEGYAQGSVGNFNTLTTTFFTLNPSSRVGHSPLGPAYDNGIDSMWPSANITLQRFDTIATTPGVQCSGPESHTWPGAVAAPTPDGLDALLWAGVSTGDPGFGELIALAAGADPPIRTNASWRFMFNNNGLPGSFVIDTCCRTPANHLQYADSATTTAIDPAFTKGIIVIGSDSDGDLVPDEVDNCPSLVNFGQGDHDGDGLGDACDSLVITVYSPVNIIVINPAGTDSIAPDGVNTIGISATYDSLTDYGIGPNGVPGESDDRVVILESELGAYTIRIVPEPGADTTSDYFLGVRDPGGDCYGVRDPGGDLADEAFVCVTGVGAPYISDTAIANPVPEFSATVSLIVAPEKRRGDMNSDGVYDVVDVVGIIGVAFRNAAVPDPPALADVNSDGGLGADVLDVVRIVGCVFRNQPKPGP